MKFDARGLKGHESTSLQLRLSRKVSCSQPVKGEGTTEDILLIAKIRTEQLDAVKSCLYVEGAFHVPLLGAHSAPYDCPSAGVSFKKFSHKERRSHEYGAV